jgi:hypothetical protein
MKRTQDNTDSISTLRSTMAARAEILRAANLAFQEALASGKEEIPQRCWSPISIRGSAEVDLVIRTTASNAFRIFCSTNILCGVSLPGRVLADFSTSAISKPSRRIKTVQGVWRTGGEQMKTRIIVGVLTRIALNNVLFFGGYLLLSVLALFFVCGYLRNGAYLRKKGYDPILIPAYVFAVAYPFVYYYLGMLSMFIFYMASVMATMIWSLFTKRHTTNDNNPVAFYFELSNVVF